MIDYDQPYYLAVCWQSQSFQCQTPNPKISWVEIPRYGWYFQIQFILRVFVFVIQNTTWSFKKVRQFCPCQSFGSFFIQSNLVANSQVCTLSSTGKLSQNHNCKPFDFNAIVIPGPVAEAVIAMRSVHCCSNPPLVAIPDISNILGRRTWYINYIWSPFLMYDYDDNSDDD